ncbi:MAG: polysaccharide biosynthesis protein [Candidatus Omnitrophota bacterium]
MKKDKNSLAGSELSNFKKVIKLGISLVEKAAPETFLSPYSLLAPLSQILGLNTPSMGDGDSPYSVVSFIFKLHNEISLFKEAFAIPLNEKRKIIDEFYEMIAPSLLRAEDEYIEVVINTKYKYALGKGAVRQEERLEKILKQKFSCFFALLKLFKNKRADFGYIVHYGYPEDLYREHSFLEKLPRASARLWRDHSFPIVNEIVLNNFSAFAGKTKTNIRGWVIFIANYTKELLEDSRLRRRKILQAAKLAEKLGAEMIGMGGLIASFAQGGQWLSGQLKNTGLTTGHAYTIGNILAMMDDCVGKVGLDIENAAVAVIGAAGSIGSGCVKLLAERNPRSIFLIDLNNFNAREKLEMLKTAVEEKNPGIKIVFSTQLADIKKADVIIIATNSPTSLVTSRYLKPGAILIDDSFPKNASCALLKERDDIILLEGGIMQLPFDIDVFFSRNMPDLMDAPLTRILSCRETYGCFAETLVLALYGHKGNYGLGDSDPRLAKDIMARAWRAGLSLAPLQCFDEAVEEARLQKAKRIIAHRLSDGH